MRDLSSSAFYFLFFIFIYMERRPVNITELQGYGLYVKILDTRL
jgi:hypothetical protein